MWFLTLCCSFSTAFNLNLQLLYAAFLSVFLFLTLWQITFAYSAYLERQFCALRVWPLSYFMMWLWQHALS